MPFGKESLARDRYGDRLRSGSRKISTICCQSEMVVHENGRSGSFMSYVKAGFADRRSQ